MSSTAKIATFFGAVVLAAGPALAQVQGRQNEVHVFAGGLFGDDLTDRRVSGDQPELDDDVTFGGRYGYDFTKHWGIEGSVAFSPNSATDVPGSDIDMDILTLDVDAVWHFTPDARAVGYLMGGAGFITADLDEPIRGTVRGKDVRIDDDSGFTLNGGVGVKFFVAEVFMIRVEARYRFVDALLDRFDDSLNTVETTVGAGWIF